MRPFSRLRFAHRMLVAAPRRRAASAVALMVAVTVAAVFALALGPLSTRAVQNPAIALDMVTTSNSYTPGVDQDTDDDNDSWSDGAERTIGTDPLDACPDDTSDNAWPADMDNDTFIDVGDVGTVTNHFGDAVPPAPAG